MQTAITEGHCFSLMTVYFLPYASDVLKWVVFILPLKQLNQHLIYSIYAVYTYNLHCGLIHCEFSE